MSQKLNWDKAKKWIPRESMFEDGKVFRNGQVVKHRLDKLAFRAKRAEEAWLKRKKK